MQSATTRLAASVLAIAIPLAPQAAHATTKASPAPAHTRQQAELLSADTLTASRSHAATAISADAKSSIAQAIESASTAAAHAILAIEAAAHADTFSAVYANEDLAHARIALEAAYAEVSYARTLVPAQATQLGAALDAILTDLRTLSI